MKGLYFAGLMVSLLGSPVFTRAQAPAKPASMEKGIGESKAFQKTDEPGKLRTYYIAADEVNWNYLPKVRRVSAPRGDTK